MDSDTQVLEATKTPGALQVLPRKAARRIDVLAGMPRERKVLLYAMGTIEELIDEGIMTGPKQMTPKGRAGYSELKRRGFRPSDRELRRAVEYLTLPQGA